MQEMPTDPSFEALSMQESIWVDAHNEDVSYASDAVFSWQLLMDFLSSPWQWLMKTPKNSRSVINSSSSSFASWNTEFEKRMCILAISSMASELSVGSFKLVVSKQVYQQLLWLHCLVLQAHHLLFDQVSPIHGDQQSEAGWAKMFWEYGYVLPNHRIWLLLANMQDSNGNWELPSQSGLLKGWAPRFPSWVQSLGRAKIGRLGWQLPVAIPFGGV